ncbi:RagB/SusD family nutrient uptake outer membrane protein [uncultured Maribacter sp.]|uniref:RagB/SusD family nutrient uptake outer membrane protein n=1 Tax=uncultured Maribacter sp. TaxID=431308 RepID=UPI0026024BD8|nr:RagB/SusD family nutrient uptake outer membrane protein [uncultured Maribacter sp.]
MLKYIKYKNFKNFKIATCALILSFGAWSCDDLVDEEPISEIGPASFYETNDDLLASLISVYDGMQSFYKDQYFHWGEFRSDNHLPTGASANNDEIANNVISDGNGATRWTDLYRTVSRANEVILNAPKIAGFNENYLAEALAIRAKSYFDAVRVWGNVPLFTEPVKSLDDVSRPATDASTIINDVVIPDMIRAIELSSIPSDNYRFSKSSIYALQAEVYMYVNDYPKAKEAIESLINLGTHRLVRSPGAWRALFYNSNTVEEPFGKVQIGPELIFSIRYDAVGEEAGSGNPNRSGISQLFRGGIPSFLMSPDVEAKWVEKFPTDSTEWVTKYPGVNPATTRTVLVDDGMGGVIPEERYNYGDWRYFFSRQDGFSGLSSILTGEAKTGKWGDTVYPASDDETDVVVYRYADMILLLAEIENELNADGVRALELVNEIRTARQLPQVDAVEFGSNPAERLDFILDERRFELYGEAKRYWDLVRNDKAIETLTPIIQGRGIAEPLTQERLLWPIHNDHLLENDLLSQNAGY